MNFEKLLNDLVVSNYFLSNQVDYLEDVSLEVGLLAS